jgi:hypothetical protein
MLPPVSLSFLGATVATRRGYHLQVDTAQLLHELRSHAQHDPVEIPLLAIGETRAHGGNGVAILVFYRRCLFLLEASEPGLRPCALRADLAPRGRRRLFHA